MIRLLPIWATTIMFWTTYAQMITFSVEQASTMERSIGSFQIPAGSLTVFFVGAILITLAFYDRIIIPLWKRWKGKHGMNFIESISLLSIYIKGPLICLQSLKTQEFILKDFHCGSIKVVNSKLSVAEIQMHETITFQEFNLLR